MWLWGLVALPMLGIVVEWCLEERRWPGVALLVALAWFGNFYTAMMARMAACVLLASRLITRDMTGRQRLRALWRAATAAGSGILLTVPAPAAVRSCPPGPRSPRGPPPSTPYGSRSSSRACSRPRTCGAAGRGSTWPRSA